MGPRDMFNAVYVGELQKAHSNLSAGKQGHPRLNIQTLDHRAGMENRLGPALRNDQHSRGDCEEPMESSQGPEAAHVTAASQGAATQGTPSSQGAAVEVAGSGPSASAAGSPAHQEGLPGNTCGPKAATPLERARISCDMNARYHACREAYLDTLHRWLMFGIIALGAAAIESDNLHCCHDQSGFSGRRNCCCLRSNDFQSNSSHG
jgi:hypothetical protein